MKASYTPFGEARLLVETVKNNLRFPGQYFDSETGTHYNYFRDYDPSTGRYLQSDRIGLGDGPNTFGYAQQNPLRYIDPTGEYVVPLISLIATAVGYFMTPNVANAPDVGEEAVGSSPLDLIPACLGGGAAAAFSRGAVKSGSKGIANKTVGRHMSPSELAKMKKTGRVQEGGGGQTRVADPSNPNAYKNAPPGDRYVEFDVPANRVKPHSEGTGRIPGPNSPDARAAAKRGSNTSDFEMPSATNIKEF